jgi:hypothetical protein
MNVVVLLDLVDTWVSFFRDRIEAALLPDNSVPNESNSTAMSGSKVIDLLECCMDYEKGKHYCQHDSQVSTKYTGRSLRITNYHHGLESTESMTVHEKTGLHECLRLLVNINTTHRLTEIQTEDENTLSDSDCTLYFHSSYHAQFECDKILYYQGQFSKHKYSEMFQKNNAHGDDLHVTFKVDLKCRKELAPIDIFLELINKSSLEDVTGRSSQTMEDSSADLELKLEIHCPAAGRDCNRSALSPLRIQCLIGNKGRTGPSVGYHFQTVRPISL